MKRHFIAVLAYIFKYIYYKLYYLIVHVIINENISIFNCFGISRHTVYCDKGGEFVVKY